MTHRRSAGSIFWGVTLVVIGGLLLAANFGYAIPAWSALSQYWPVLIIVWGLAKLIDYYRFREGNERRPLFSAGEVAILIVLIFAGSALTMAANLSPRIGDFLELHTDLDLWHITGNNYEFSEHHETEAASGSTIEIVNLFGNVDVQPSEDNRIVLDVRKTVRASSRDEAELRSRESFTFSIGERDGKIRIASSLDDGAAQQRRFYRSSMTIRVPAAVSLQVNNRNGAVTVSGLIGDQTVVNRNGQVTIRDINGSAGVENRYASVVAEDVSGALRVTNRNGSVTVRNVGGSLQVENGYGAVDVRGVGGGATISNTYSAVTAANIEGPLVVTGRNNSVDISDVTGPLVVETSYKSLGIRNASGSIDARNRHGEILIELDETPQSPVSVSGQYGDIVLRLPPGSAAGIEARTRSGQIISDFDELPVSSSNRERFVSGRLGAGGPEVKLETRNGNIRIETHE